MIITSNIYSGCIMDASFEFWKDYQLEKGEIIHLRTDEGKVLLSRPFWVFRLIRRVKRWKK